MINCYPHLSHPLS